MCVLDYSKEVSKIRRVCMIFRINVNIYDLRIRFRYDFFNLVFWGIIEMVKDYGFCFMC